MAPLTRAASARSFQPAQGTEENEPGTRNKLALLGTSGSLTATPEPKTPPLGDLNADPFSLSPLTPQSSSGSSSEINISLGDLAPKEKLPESNASIIQTLERIFAGFRAIQEAPETKIIDAQYTLSCKRILTLVQLYFCAKDKKDSDNEYSNERKALLDAVESAVIIFILHISPVILLEYYVASTLTFTQSPKFLAALLEATDAYINQSTDYISQLRMAAVLQLIKDEPAAHRWLEPYRNIFRTQSTAAKNMSFAVPRSGMLLDPKQDIPHQYSVGTLGKKRGPEPYIRAYTASPTMASSTSCPVGRFAASPSVLSSLRTFTPSPSLLRHSPGDNLPSLPLLKLVSPHTPQNSFYAQFKDAFGLSEPSPLPPSSGVSYFEIDFGAIDVAATTSPLGPVSSALDGSKYDSPGYTALTKALADCLVMDQQAPAANFEAASTPNLGSPFEVGSGTSLFSPLSNNLARESTSFQEVAGRALDKEATISDDDEAQFPGIKNRNTNNDIESGPEAVEISSPLTFRSNNYQFLVMNQDSPTALHQKHKQRLQDPELDTETDKGATAMMTSTSSKQLYVLTESPKGNNNKAKKRKVTGDAESIKQALGKVGTRVVSSTTKTRRLVSGTGIEKENESLFGRE